MSDQATLSSFEDSISQNNNPNITTTTTPPIGDYSSKLGKNASSILSKSMANPGNDTSDDFVDSLPNVLSSLNLDENSVFSTAKIPSTPPSEWKFNTNTNTWGNNSGFQSNHAASNSGSGSSLKDETIDNINLTNSSLINANDNSNKNTGNTSFILPDNYLFEQSITTTTPNASSILSPNKLPTSSMNLNTQTPASNILGKLSSPNHNSHQQPLHHPHDSNDTLGMGISQPMDTNQFFGNFIPTPNQQNFAFNPHLNPHTLTPPLNGLSTSLNLLPNPINNPFSPVINGVTNYQNTLLNPSNYNILMDNNNNNNNNNNTNNNNNNNNTNSKIDDSCNSNINNNTNNNTNNHANNINNKHTINNRNNLGLNSTANIHRKHTSNNKRGEDASRFVNATLNDFVNEIYYLCKDQHGCRFLQRQLELNGEIAATKIFNEIQLNVIELMIDPFGNYLIQKLLERVNENQRTTLVRNASNQFVRIALDPHGTRALQKLVECISTETEFQIIINSLSSYVVLLSRDLNGNHVIQKCLQKLPPNYCNFIFDAACDNCVKIAKHRHGCCVLQRCFDHGTPNQCEKLSLKVGENAVELSIDPYGNYVVQYVLSMEENRLRIQNDPSSINKIPDTSKSIDFIINSLGTNLTKLSTHKFGSNVIEKSLRIPTLSPVLIKQLLNHPESLKLLLHDAYGNYVLQTSLDVADDSSFKDLSELLRPYLSDVRNTPHGRRILSKLISRGGNAAAFGANTNQLLNEPVDINVNYENNNNNNNHHNSNHNNNNNNSNHPHHHNNNGNHIRRNNYHYNNNNNNNNNSGYNHSYTSNYERNGFNNTSINKNLEQINRFGY